MARRGRIGAPASRTEGRPRQIPWRMRIDKGAAYNGAGGVDLALEHAPLPSSRERTTRSSAHTRGGGGVFLKKHQYTDSVSTTVVHALMARERTTPYFVPPFVHVFVVVAGIRSESTISFPS
jgi:hypothetical protein